MPKIALIMPALGSGGVEKVMINLATGFLEKKWDVDVVVTKAEGEFKSLLPEQINLVDLQASRVLYGVPRLVQYFRRNKPHAVISAIDHQNIATLCSIKLSGVRPRPVTLVSVHIDAIEQYAHARSFKERILPIIVKKFYSKANKIITVSEGAAQSFSIKTKIPLNKIKVIYNPVVTPKMLSEANEEVVHPWFNHKDRKIIIGVGRLTKEKDFITLIKAFHLLRKKMLARLVILGEGEERPRLEAFIKELGLSEDIALLGFVK
ncbi:MAG: glycosyltransferase, partial [Thermoanaerobacterium sp.]|nr:glycosyltransferase [Thermoanaerobacterium sp.]